MCFVLCALYFVLCTLCFVLCALYFVLCTLCFVLCALYFVLCTLCFVLCALYFVLCSSYFVFCLCFSAARTPTQWGRKCKVQGTDFRSMNLRLRGVGPCLQQIEIATLIGLRDMCRIQGAKASFVTRRIGYPFCAALVQFVIADMQFQLASLNIQFDEIAVLHKRQWPTNERLRRNVQHTSA